MDGRTIGTIGPERVEDYLDIYLDAYPAFKSLDEDCRRKYREKTLRDMAEDQEVEFIGLYEGEELIATMKLVNFRMDLYGRMQPAVGLMSLAVHPLHKKQGAALEMVRYYERYAEEKGADVAILLPFNMSFYRKMGYGLGARMDEYHIPTGHLPASRDREDDRLHLRMIPLSRIDEVLACHEAFARGNHGMLIKFEEEIRDMREDSVTRRVGYYDNDKLLGYAAYRFINTSEVNYTLNEITVDELIYRDGSVLRALLGYLRDQADLAQSIRIRSGEEDFYHLLDDAADLSGNYIPFGYLQTGISAVGNMYKILNPARFIKNTSYRTFPEASLTARFDYLDEMRGKEESLTISFKAGRWEVTEEKPEITIKGRMSDLSSLLMNAGRLASFLRLGVMEADRMERAEELDRLLYYSQKPFSNSDF